VRFLSVADGSARGLGVWAPRERPDVFFNGVLCGSVACLPARRDVVVKIGSRDSAGVSRGPLVSAVPWLSDKLAVTLSICLMNMAGAFGAVWLDARVPMPGFGRPTESSEHSGPGNQVLGLLLSWLLEDGCVVARFRRSC